MLSTGTTLGGRYAIQSLLGHGGMGAVYCARDQRLGREVAIKLLRADLAADAAARQRFLREGQIAAQIIHPNVVRTYDAGDDPAGPYIVQEFLLGETLDRLIPVPPRQAAAILRPIAAALGHIHGRGYVHCDVKPQNILLRDNGTPVLLDFGIARVEGSETSALIATPHYLAPERAQGAPPTAAADLYALGIVLFQAVAGKPPFEGSAVPAIIRQHIEQPVPRLGVEDPAAPVLDRIIARLTAKRPEDRYSSTVDLENDLRTVEQGAVHNQPTVPVAAQALAEAPALPPPRPASPQQTLRRAWADAPAWRRRRWLVAVLAPLALTLLGLGFIRASGRDGEASAPSTPATAPALSQTTSATTPALSEPTATPAPALSEPTAAPAPALSEPTAAPAPALSEPTAAPAPVLSEPTAAPVPQSIAVPAVVGLPYDQAAVLLSEQGLVAQRGDEQPAAQPPGTISGTVPPATTVVERGATVLLHVSTGPASEPLPVPPLPAPANDTSGGDANDGKPDQDNGGGGDDEDGDNKDSKPDRDNGKADDKGGGNKDKKPDKDNGKGNDDKND